MCHSITHSSPTIPEAASSSKSSVKDTLFLSKAESEWMVVGKGGVPGLGPRPLGPQPEKDRVLVDRVGELGQRKIPGLRLTDWVPSFHPAEGEMERVHRDRDRAERWR